MLPPKDRLTICFAHVAYQLQERFLARQTGIRSFQVRSARRARSPDRRGRCAAGLRPLAQRVCWTQAGRLRFIQSISAGTDQYPRFAAAARGIRLASAQGTNERAVAEHAMALILALTRRLPEARDHQARRHWRGMISDLSAAARTSWAARPC